MNKVILLLCLSAALCLGQTATISSPTTNQTLSGTSVTARVTLTSAPNACIGKWRIDTEEPQYVRLENVSDLSWTFNSHDYGNSDSHLISFTALDCLQATVATATPVVFKILNTNQVNSQMTVMCGTPTSSTWVTHVYCDVTFTGSPSGLTTECFIDGFRMGTNSGLHTCDFVTTFFLDAYQHAVSVSATATNTATTTSTFAAWGRFVTFGNTTTNIGLRVDSQEMFVAIGGTYQLAAPKLVDAAGNLTSPTTVRYDTDTPTACSVSGSGLVTGIAFGRCHIVVSSTNPLMGTALLDNPNPGIASGDMNPISIQFTACPAVNQPGPFWVLIGTEMFATNTFGAINCDGSPPTYTSGRAELNTTAAAHAHNAVVNIPFQREVNLWVDTTNVIKNFGTDGQPHDNAVSNSMWIQTNFAIGYDSYFNSFYTKPNLSFASYLRLAWNSWEISYTPNCTPGSNDGCDTLAQLNTTMDTYLNTVSTNFQAAGPGTYAHPSLHPVLNPCGGTTCSPWVTGTGGGFATPAITALEIKLLAKTIPGQTGFLGPCRGIDEVTLGHVATDAIWTTLKNQLQALSPYCPFTQSPQGGQHAEATDVPWQAPPNGQYTIDYTAGTAYYLSPIRASVYMTSVGILDPINGLRRAWSNVGLNQPLNGLTSGFSHLYYPAASALSPSITVTGCADDLCTTSADHHIRNVIDGVTRVRFGTFSGGANASYYNNLDAYIDSAPSSTTFHISRRYPTNTWANASGSDCNGGACYLRGGTATFSNSTTAGLAPYPGTPMSGTSTSQLSQFSFQSPTCPLQKLRGLTFTVAGTQIYDNSNVLVNGTGHETYFNTHKFYYRGYSANCDSVGGTAYWSEVPTGGLIATSGTAQIIYDNNWVNGQALSSVSNPATFGPWAGLSMLNTNFLLGSVGVTDYVPHWEPLNYGIAGLPNLNTNCNAGNAIWFAPTEACVEGGGTQVGGNPFVEDGSGSFSMFYSHVAPLQVFPRVVPYKYQARCPGVDLGPMFLTACNTGTNGTVVSVQNISNITQPATVTMTAYQTANAMWRATAAAEGVTFAALPANTTTNTFNLSPGAAAYLVAPATPDPMTFPTLKVNIAAVSNAAKAIVEAGCMPYLWYDQKDYLPIVADLGSGGVGQVPIDLNACPRSKTNPGAFQYAVRYLDSNGRPLGPAVKTQ